MKNWIKIPKSNIKTAIIAVIVLFSLLLPNVVWAAKFYEYMPGYQLINLFKKAVEFSPADIGRAMLVEMSQFILRLLNWLVNAGGSVFEGMLTIGFQSHFHIVEAGWGVTRDFANMFFILFLVIIAFATILRLPQYGIRNLLPKVIIIALLVNFSLVICKVIIDFSNIAAGFFISDARRYTTEEGGIYGRFSDSLNLSKSVMVLNCDDELLSETEKTECEEAKTKYKGTDVMSILVSMTVGSLVMLVAAFTFFAGAFLLLIRIVIIWFLLMFVPLVFLCYIMPGLQRMWQDWWKTFLKWCFFAPAYAFFIWLAMKVAIEGKAEYVAKTAAGKFTDVGPLGTIWTSAPATALIHYFFIIALLLGGLIAASKFGIYGADATMKVGQRMAGVERVKRYMKARKAVREEEKKEAVKRRLRLRETGGLRQAIKERVPGEIGRRARARRADVIKTEADRLAKTYSPNDMRRIAGYRGFTGYRRTYRLAAARALTDKRLSTEIGKLPKAQVDQINQLVKKLGKTLSRYPTRRKEKEE